MDKKNNIGFLGVNHKNKDRQHNDYYATSPQTIKSLLKVEKVFGDILEPACGEGHISKYLEKEPNVKSVTSTDLVDRGFGEGGIDFLNHDYERKFDIVITNPPFSLGEQFVRKALEVSSNKVILLFRIQFLESVSRYELFKTTPLKHVYVFSSRQCGWKNGKMLDENGKKWSATMALCWFVWEHGYNGDPTIKWIEPNNNNKLF